MVKFNGRKVKIKKSFQVPGTFESLYAAQRYVLEMGYDYGSTCAHEPTAIMKESYDLPQKWKNFSAEEKKSVDGVMIGDNREGPVTVLIFN